MHSDSLMIKQPTVYFLLKVSPVQPNTSVKAKLK